MEFKHDGVRYNAIPRKHEMFGHWICVKRVDDRMFPYADAHGALEFHVHYDEITPEKIANEFAEVLAWKAERGY